MNFGDKIKAEIFSHRIKETHCKRAFLAGLVRGSGLLYESEGKLGLSFRVPGEEAAMYAGALLQSLYGYDVREVSVAGDGRKNRERFVLNICGDGADEILKDLGVLFENEGRLEVNMNLYGGINERECCLKSFVRGLFAASGTCIVPGGKKKNERFHFEIPFSHFEPASDTVSRLGEFGIKLKIARRRDGFMAYIKSAEEIKDFLAFLQVPVSVLSITEMMINREIVNDSNRRKNCDLYNVSRQVEASAKQSEAIEKIAKMRGLDFLKKDLAAVAAARLDNPDETLGELAERLGITKSCLNHRLRKIIAIANEL